MTEVMADEIEKLIERLEKAAGPDRELDKEILRSTGYAVPNQARLEDWMIERSLQSAAPNYTSSIDAALTLVPRKYDGGFYGDKLILIADGKRWTCVTQSAENVGHWSEDWKVSSGIAPSAAIALCIAALRALSHKGASND